MCYKINVNWLKTHSILKITEKNKINPEFIRKVSLSVSALVAPFLQSEKLRVKDLPWLRKMLIYWTHTGRRPIMHQSVPFRSHESRRFTLQIHHGDIRGGSVATLRLLVWWLGNKLHSQGKAFLRRSHFIWFCPCCSSWRNNTEVLESCSICGPSTALYLTTVNKETAM